MSHRLNGNRFTCARYFYGVQTYYQPWFHPTALLILYNINYFSKDTETTSSIIRRVFNDRVIRAELVDLTSKIEQLFNGVGIST